MRGTDQNQAVSGGDGPAVVLGELIRRSTAVAQVMAHELGLSVGDLNALHHLVGRAPMGPAELGKRLAISTASATVLVDRLEQAGYVRRRRDPGDRRRVVLEVTDAAASRSLDAVRPLVDAAFAIDDEFDEPTRHAIAGYLSRVVDAMATFTDVTSPRTALQARS